MKPTFVVRRDAMLSPCGRYRYTLTRQWDALFADTRHRVLFVMCNPSTADAEQDDRTIRRCIGYARSWSYTSLEVVNLFAWRATDPDDLVAAAARGEDIVGPENDRHISDALKRCQIVVAAWGRAGGTFELAGVGGPRWRYREVLALIRARFLQPRCLRLTTEGHPSHPLYLRADLQHQPFLDPSGRGVGPSKEVSQPTPPASPAEGE